MKQFRFLDDLTPALDRKDSEKVLSFLTDDCLFQAGNSEAIKGKEAIAATLDGFFPAVKSIKHNMTDSFETNNSVVYRGTVTYTRLDDSQLTLPVCDVFKMSGNLISEYYIYIDWSELF